MVLQIAVAHYLLPGPQVNLLGNFFSTSRRGYIDAIVAFRIFDREFLAFRFFGRKNVFNSRCKEFQEDASMSVLLIHGRIGNFYRWRQRLWIILQVSITYYQDHEFVYVHQLNMGSILLYGTHLAINLRLNMGTVLLYGTNLAVNLRLNMGAVLLYGTNLAVNLRLNMGSIPLCGTNL